MYAAKSSSSRPRWVTYTVPSACIDGTTRDSQRRTGSFVVNSVHSLPPSIVVCSRPSSVPT